MELTGKFFMCYVHSASLCLYGVDYCRHFFVIVSVLCLPFFMCYVCLFITKCHCAVAMSSVTVFFSLLQVGT